MPNSFFFLAFFFLPSPSSFCSLSVSFFFSLFCSRARFRVRASHSALLVPRALAVPPRGPLGASGLRVETTEGGKEARGQLGTGAEGTAGNEGGQRNGDWEHGVGAGEEMTEAEDCSFESSLLTFFIFFLFFFPFFSVLFFVRPSLLSSRSLFLSLLPSLQQLLKLDQSHNRQSRELSHLKNLFHQACDPSLHAQAAATVAKVALKGTTKKREEEEAEEEKRYELQQQQQQQSSSHRRDRQSDEQHESSLRFAHPHSLHFDTGLDQQR